ncbi:MAG: hypothetical protein IKE36_08520 [Solobacterium sp.]|nr:hypothetical protein [Solobacterium sp.]
MAKKAYSSPIFFGITPGDDPGIVLPPSQGTSGYDSPYTFEGIDETTLDLIDLWCDDIDLKDMDTNGNYVITAAEFQAWWDSQEKKPW